MTLYQRLLDLGIVGYSEGEVRFVLETMADLQPDLLVEWGTNVGHSARMFHEAKQELGLHTVIHSVDIVDEVPILRPEDAGKKRGFHVEGLDVLLHVGHGASEAVSLSAWAERPLFFSDDSHGYGTLTADLELLHNDVPRAVILVHDVTLTLAKFTECDLAVRDFAIGHVDDYYVTETTGGMGMVRLWPK